MTEALKKNIANKARIERLSLNFNMLFIKKQITKVKKKWNLNSAKVGNNALKTQFGGILGLHI